MKQQELQVKINNAANVIGKTWPLYSFVTSNPLSGYEGSCFFEAIEQAGNFCDTFIFNFESFRNY